MRILKELQMTEAKRRLKMLGKTVEDDNEVFLKQRAQSLELSVTVLRQWHHCYRRGGLDALLPTTWQELSDAEWARIEQRYTALEEMAEKEVVTEEDIASLATRRGWSSMQARRWLGRYRTGGLYGLAPLRRPKKESVCPDLGTLSEAQLGELFRRRDLLGELAEHDHLSNADVAKRAEEGGVSRRTIRMYHSQYRRDGLKGLAPLGRTDKGKTHTLSATIVQMIEHLRLSHRDAPIRFVYDLTREYATETGERAPSLWQVRSICAQIPAPVRVLADGREETFRNSYRLTYPIHHEANRIVWQIDHKAPLHVLVRDLRAPSHRSLTEEVRPYLTLVIDSASRLVMAGLFSYDQPDRFMVAAAIRAAMLTTEQKPFGGVPDEIWVDNGKDLIAHHVSQLVQGLGSTLSPGPPHQPQIRGIVERFHETLDTRLWATLQGYVGANVVERNPLVKAELTLSQLEQRFRAFVEQYHQEVHSSTGHTPLHFWHEHATPLPVNERMLDVLLKEPAQRRVLKEGIKYGGRIYWHAELATLVGEDVIVRAAPSYTTPDEVEVYFEQQWHCTAFALDSAKGQALPRSVVADAQRRQRAHARRRITTAHNAVESSPHRQEESSSTRRETSPPELPHLPFSPERSPDIFDFLLTERTRKATSHDS